jgi:hypothetical protein
MKTRMLRRSRPVVALAVALALAGSTERVRSASADAPRMRPASAVMQAWFAQLRGTAYVAASGHRLLFGSALGPLESVVGTLRIAEYEPGIVRDGKRGLVKMCFVVAPCGTHAEYTAVVRARDVPAPPAFVAGAIDDPTIGLTVAALFARFRADPNFVGKNIAKDARGAAYFITSYDQDPPPARYDHGYRARFENDYVISDDRVVAHIFAFEEN